MSRVIVRSSGPDCESTMESLVSVDEKPVAMSSGISLYIILAEPVLFLRGSAHHEDSDRPPAMLRGNLIVQITKAVKLKSIVLKFRGKARTEWPEGIPPKHVDLYEEELLNAHVWPFFNAQFPHTESGHGANYSRLGHPPGTMASRSSTTASSARLAFDQLVRSASPASFGSASREHRRRSLQIPASSCQDPDENELHRPSMSQKGYRTFLPGEYLYNFELPLDIRLPETISVDLGSVKYELEAIVERAGPFRGNVVGVHDVTLVRAPAESSLEQVEPIAISRDWEDQLHYDIVISGKSFALGTQVPVAFKLTPLAKIQCHRIRIFVTENIEYYCSNRKVHRLEPARKVLLFEKRADGPSVSTFPGSSVRILAGGGVDHDSRAAKSQARQPTGPDNNNLLGDADGSYNAGSTEMEFGVQLPGCHDSVDGEKSQQIHLDATSSNIRINHWIKIVMRLSKPDQVHPSKRRHFEISIDSPLHIMSCLATQANTALPPYSSVDLTRHQRPMIQCPCPGSVWRTSPPNYRPRARQADSSNSDPRDGTPTSELPTITSPVAAHLASGRAGPVRRPHLPRYLSRNPPAFDADLLPPPMMSPPPRYDSVVENTSGLAGYFSRLSHGMDDEPARSGSRFNLPLTPGGRVNRSMDEQRTWLPPGHPTT